MQAPERIDTPRLTLRQPRPDDAEAIFERYASSPAVTRFLGWPRHQSIQDTQVFLRFSALEWERRGVGPYLIVSPFDGLVLGSTGLALNAAQQAATGYVLAEDAWGNGYATEALRAMVVVASQLEVSRVSALCHPEHHPSRHVLEKCGFVRDETRRPQVTFPNLSPGVKQEALRYTLDLLRTTRPASTRFDA